MDSLLSSLSLNSCSSKIKLDEFFADYCLSEEFSLHQNELSQHQQNLNPLMKKSPKKRTHEDLDELHEDGSPSHPKELFAAIEHTLDMNHHTIHTMTSTTRRRANFDTIPIFYQKSSVGVNGSASLSQGTKSKSCPIEEDQLYPNSNKLNEIETLFKKYNNVISSNDFVDVTKYLCGFPSFFNSLLISRIHLLYAPANQRNQYYQSNSVQLSSFLEFWKNEIAPYDRNERFFNLIKQPSNNYITKDDFFPYLHELLDLHPGLEFLENHEEFQKKYAMTVITRIFYKVNLSRTGKITLKELKQSDLRQVFLQVDEETEINRVTEYFR